MAVHLGDQDAGALAVDLGTGGGLAAHDTMDGGRRSIFTYQAQARNQALQPARRTMFSGRLTLFGTASNRTGTAPSGAASVSYRLGRP